MAYTRKKRQKTKVAAKPKIRSKEVIYDGIKFDSETECDYYKYLKTRDDVLKIDVHPEYELIPTFTIKSSITKSGKSKKSAMRFTPDFKVTYSNGRVEVVDVKGHKRAINEGFPIRKKLWEFQNQQELIVAIWDKKLGQWTRS
ncbi:hypothetical protein COE79_20625 [Bacillus toyonensis]|uniref:DUF1064 domain-containing protein n=1 Tax=Bacillus toyonensis TaxID=155322 RepID=UPI000BFE13F4|nr:DUF1064 domain-containing protein [Bacillus toyonensis]PHA98698.1 hypothetical protein COE79_20625 [Bacillus toyonensis]